MIMDCFAGARPPSSLQVVRVWFQSGFAMAIKIVYLYCCFLEKLHGWGRSFLYCLVVLYWFYLVFRGNDFQVCWRIQPATH